MKRDDIVPLTLPIDQWLQLVQCRDDIVVSVCSGNKMNSVTLLKKWQGIAKFFHLFNYYCCPLHQSGVAMYNKGDSPASQWQQEEEAAAEAEEWPGRRCDSSTILFSVSSAFSFLFLNLSFFFLLPSFPFLLLLVPVVIPQLRHFTADDWQVVEVAGMQCQADLLLSSHWSAGDCRWANVRDQKILGHRH